MRIGIFHPTLDVYGGAEIVAVATANALAQNGFDVLLFMNKSVEQKRIKKMVGAPLSPSIRVITKPAVLPQRGSFHLYESAARSLIFKSHCDILIDTYSCFIYPWIDVSYMHFPYLNNYDYSPKFPYLIKPHFRQALTLPYALFEKNIEDYSGKLILANSYFTARAIKESLGADSKVLYPPVPNALFEKKMNFDSPREDMVVTIARFGPSKGVELVPEIARFVDKNINFVMIGLAQDLNVLQAVKNRIHEFGIDNRVSVITDASRQDIISYLTRAKVYLHTTKMEHFGISIAEAMAFGCLPVVHDSGGAPEFVPDQYRYKDSKIAAMKVEQAITKWSPQKAKSMVNTAERFSENNFSKRLIDLFNEYCSFSSDRR